MNKHTSPLPQNGSNQLRQLLTLSRELLQTDDYSGSLSLIGRTLVRTVECDSALLLVRDGSLDLCGFDCNGNAYLARTEHPLYSAGAALLPHRARRMGQDDDGGPPEPSERILALAVPAPAAIAILVAAWDNDLPPAAARACRRTMSAVLELAAAALGKIKARGALEQLVKDLREELANNAMVHAAELSQRDGAVGEMHVLALTDVLTGLYNRRGFFLQAEQIFRISRRQRTHSAVIFADIDGLKRVNDELGHDAGDALLRDAAHVFRQSFRQADVVSRLGGDEFVAYTLDDEQPQVILERLDANLRAHNLMQERPYMVSMSAGVVQCDPASEQPLSDYVQLADEHMYTHKRNRLH
ncbi:GGDEF domain-containing protein [Massilia sp. Dwa41.01b]|uniref:GGDEF domain-containing protein n=1 Tax=unclassified Massilia TaxID=2609279 RepID=UPI00160255A7|nr:MULTISPECIES: GGDEF domain-containing protein [unclassified Massilia]QNA89904.1 GGDEF domain-containing protein [Massilia sp. Dwa41.01b]QNB00789.1 GGDEF domain-containing protein [Massilia sp. Se16.2.3]